MQVIVHAGVHCTDEDRLLRCLLRNVDILRPHGVGIPGPGRYRKMLDDVLRSLEDDIMPSPDARDVILDAMLDEDADGIDRLVLSNEDFFSNVSWCLTAQKFYARAEAVMRGFSRIFAGDDVTLMLGIRDPATFLPAAFKASKADNLMDFLRRTEPMDLRWSDLVQRIRDMNPDMPITIWCNEDTPLLWGQILRDATGMPVTQKMRGSFDLLSEIMKPEGMKRFRAYLGQHDLTEQQRRRVMMAFLDKYAIEDQIEEELDLPGWDEAYVDALSDAYEDDVERISRIPGVTLMTP